MQGIDLRQAAARAVFCRLLAGCYYEPGPEFVEEKLFGSMLDLAVQIEPQLATSARRLGEAFFEQSAESLLIDYTRLFLGPNHILANPYGSFWIEREHGLMQDSTMAVQALYAEGGFELDDDFHELPDHIAVELEFLYLLLHDEAESVHHADAAALAAVRALRGRFLGAHLGRWAGPFTVALAAGAQSDFYRELAGITGHFLGILTRIPEHA